MPSHEFPHQTLEQLLAQDRRQALTTTRQVDPEGNYSIRVTCDALDDRPPFVVAWRDELDVIGNHAAAALKAHEELGWHKRNHLVMGGVGADGYVFCQVPARHWPARGLEYAVDDVAGREHVFDNFSEAAGYAVSIATTGSREEVHLDVLTWDRDAAVAYGGDDAGEVYDEDPDASVHDRIVVRAESQGRVR